MKFLTASLLALASLAAWAEAPLVDGPYVLHQAQEVSRAIWVCDGAVKQRALPRGTRLDAPCGSVSGFALNESNPVAPDVLPQPRRWVAVSDIHGQAGLFQSLLRAHKVVDAQDQWSYGDGVLVIAGDVFDRGPQQTEALWAIYRLAQQAQAAGGSVQLLLGNHESMALSGDLRYQHPKYLAVARLLGRGVSELYGKDTELGQWLRSRATLLKLGDTLFVHGGISPELHRRAPELDALNTKVRARVDQSRKALVDDPQAAWLFGGQGPLWYRGYFSLPRASLADVQALLLRFGVTRIVVGHTTQAEIVSLYGGRVIGIDAGLKDGVRGELLLWENGRLLRGLPDGRQIALPAGADDGTSRVKGPDGD